MSTPKKFYLTTPIYYVNARPHIGHAYSTIVADVIARRHRLLGDNTFFLTGTDEHGQKIERSAAAAGVPPQQFADQVSRTFSDLWKRMGITNDDFIRTTEPRHKQGVQKLFATLQANGAIEKNTYTGQYCVSDEAYVEVGPGEPCPDCGRTTETISETNYFFKLSEYGDRIASLIESNELLIQPDSRRNEILSFVRSGLKDLSISRTSFKWGIPVPGDEAHVIYVWLDALANYMTALGYGSDAPEDIEKFARYWPADLHLVGKEIIRFHCVYWPAFLLAAKLPLPKSIVANGWLLFQDSNNKASKMSKSLGNVVRTETILDAFGTLCPPPPPISNLSSSASHLSSPSASHLSSSSASHLSSPSASHLSSSSASHLSSSSASHLLSSSASHLSSSSASHLPSSSASHLSSSSAPHLSSSSVEDRGSAVPPEAPKAVADTTNAALLKGTASAVPQTTPATNPALAAEVPPSPAAPQPPTKAQQDLFATDVLRYFLLREIPFGQDGSFSFDALVTRYNADLANGYGNLVSRALNLISQNQAGTIVEAVQTDGRWQCESHVQRTDASVIADAGGTQTLIEDIQQLADALSHPIKELGVLSFPSIILLKVGFVDAYLTANAPWKLAKSDAPLDRQKMNEVLYTAAESIRIITALLYPILPYATASVWAQLGLGDIEVAAKNGDLKDLKWGGLLPGTKLGPLSPIFPRADKGLIQTMIDTEERNAQQAAAAKEAASKPATGAGAPLLDSEKWASTDPSSPPRTGSLSEANPGAHVAASAAITTERPETPSHHEAPASAPFANAAAASAIPATPQIAIDDFVKIDLRVARIVVAERIPKADKLLRLEVDLGYEKRQILSGIAEWYAPEDLIGRNIVVIANLAPRKMRGLESHGMLLAASHGENGKPVLATFGEEIALGSRLR